MSYIVVCPLVALAQCVVEHQPGAVITLLDADEPTPRLGVAKHLRLITADSGAAGNIPLVKQLIKFIASHHWQAPLLIHCMAGISRSPAAALTALAMRYPHNSAFCVQRLRQASPSAQPNTALLATADKLLATDLLPQWHMQASPVNYSDAMPFVV